MMSFTRPNLPVPVQEIEILIQRTESEAESEQD